MKKCAFYLEKIYSRENLNIIVLKTSLKIGKKQIGLISAVRLHPWGFNQHSLDSVL